jgi:hypothetical protein
MARAKQPKQIIQMTVAQFEAMFPNEDACDAYLVRNRCARAGAIGIVLAEGEIVIYAKSPSTAQYDDDLLSRRF